MSVIEESAKILGRLLQGQNTVYVTTEPGLPDFSDHKSAELTVSTTVGSECIKFDRSSVQEVWGLLRGSVFGGNYKVIGWGIHPLISYCQFYTRAPLVSVPVIYDLKVIERYMGVYEAPPASFREALSRMIALKDPAWKKVWKLVYEPLVTRVLPDIESVGLIHKPTRSAVYTHYEVEYQRQGRMQAFEFGKGFNAHTIGMSPDYVPRGDDLNFVFMDFSGMEVCVLEHLSKCPVLGQIVSSGEDVYGGIYRAVFGKDCPSPAWRDFVKRSFLAVVFGMGAKTLGKELNIAPEKAAVFINRYYTKFPVAFDYVISQIPPTATIVRDVLGRPKWHEANDYHVRNYVIQAPSATVCLERLVALHGAIRSKARLAMHIHDGYAIVCNRASSLDVYETAKASLESVSELVPGLKLRAEGKIGPSLDHLAKP